MQPSSQEKKKLGLGMRLSCMPSQLLSLPLAHTTTATGVYNVLCAPDGNNCCEDLQFGMAALSEIVVEVMAS